MKRLRAVSRRYVFTAAASMLIGAASFFGIATAQTVDEAAEFGGARWVASWSVPPMAHGSAFGGSRSFDNQTVRQIVHISAGGTRIRVKLSNEYGVGALIVGSARIAKQSSGASIVPASDRALTFRGQTSVVIPEGAVALSDPVNMSVPSNTNLAISLYVPQNTGLATYHENGGQRTYISGPGDFSETVDFPSQETTLSRYWLTFVEVLPHRRIGALAIFGDSLSEGATTTVDANLRVNDVLSRWINPPSAPARLAIINQSTGCGRLLWDFCGPKGLSRFDREVVNATGVTQVVLELGYVDIIFPTAANIPAEIVSADQIIAGLRQLIRRARVGGIKVYVATLLPNGSSPIPGVYTPENEAKRQAVNRWIRTSREFDGVADYDLALRDPSEPTRLLPAYDADGVHPNDAGHEALARAIALSLR
jgi:lysophospholipase L1-like esterase